MMISPADDEPDPRRDPAQVRFADVFRNARLTQDPGDVRYRPVGADAHILVDAELDAAHTDEAPMAGLQPLAWLAEVRSLLVGVGREPGAHIRSKARRRTGWRPGRRLCRRGRREPERQEDRGRRAVHFARPSPLSAARASTSPNPNVSSRPGAPRSTAVRSSRSSIAAGSVTPCCMI